MLGNKFNSAKCETTCRLGLGRIKLMKNKKNLQASAEMARQIKQYRKDIAELLRSGKQDYARIRVEAILRENAALQAYEILELYLELIAVRGPLIAATKEVPRDMVEAISSVLYSAQRVPDLPELATLHKMFSAKYGKEYVGEASSDVACARWMVNDALRRCLTVEPPEPALKLQALSDIAQEFGIEWDIDRARRELLPSEDGPYGSAAYLGSPPPMSPPFSGGGLAVAALPGHMVGYPPSLGSAPTPPAGSMPGYAPAPSVPHTAVPFTASGGGHPGAPPPSLGGAGSGGGVCTPGGSSGGAAVLSPGPASNGGPQPPPQGWLLGRSPAPVTAPPPAVVAPAPDGGLYLERPAQDVQAAYDAAPGPPSKPAPASTSSSAPPAAPVPPAPEADVPPAAPVAPAAAAGTAHMPSLDGEFDELQKRFEQLKRSGA